jgi:hypothetical protein
MSEEKKVSVNFEGADLVVKVDLNQDGKPAIELRVDLLQIPAEVKELLK